MKVKEYFESVEYVWTELVELGLFTDDELELVTNINGYSIESINDCIYARFGYRDFEQMTEEDLD